MAIKKIETVVCDFPHKHDRPAVARVSIDVCSAHEQMFSQIDDPYSCIDCGRTFRTKQGLGKHRASTHNGGVDEGEADNS